MDGEKREKKITFRVTNTEFQKIREKFEGERIGSQTLTDWILSKLELESDPESDKPNRKKREAILDQIKSVRKFQQALIDFYIENEE